MKSILEKNGVAPQVLKYDSISHTDFVIGWGAAVPWNYDPDHCKASSAFQRDFIKALLA